MVTYASSQREELNTDEALGYPEPLTIKIPEEVEAYREDLRRFFDAMIYKLRKNAHKGKWEGKTFEEGLEMLRAEVNELEAAIAMGNSVEINLEGADVANFALIISSIAAERGK